MFISASEPESEEDKQKKDVRERMKQEYFFAIQEEEQACKTRMELIKITAMSILQDLKNKADNAFKDMNDWLGARYLKEMERFVCLILIGPFFQRNRGYVWNLNISKCHL